MMRLGELNRAEPPRHAPAASPARAATGPVVEQSGINDDELSQLPPGEVIENSWGRHWLSERPMARIWPGGGEWLDQQLTRIRHAAPCAASGRAASGRAASGRAASGRAADEWNALIDALPEQAVFLDLETCGFAGSMVFLVGLILQRDGQLVLLQLLARHYGEEKAMLQTLWQQLSGKRVLATFNGKCFDWPMVHDRSTLHHLGRPSHHAAEDDNRPATGTGQQEILGRHDPRPRLVHCDLLHHARRRWGGKLPDCRLQTLERYVLRRRRSSDIPGRDIPAVYHDFVRTSDAWLIRAVLHHNALDLVTLLQLSVCVG